MFQWKSPLAAVGLAFFGALCAATSGQAAEKVRLIAFSGANIWPIFVAQEKQLFVEHGIDLELTFTPGSRFQMVGLIEGEFDIALTAMDNVVAYDENQGAVPTRKDPDIAAFMGLSNSFLHVVAAPDIKSYEDLKGRRLGVDAPTTGFAFVLREMLELSGVGWDDVELVEAGGVKERFDALMKNEIDATLVISPLDLVATGAGYTDLGNAAAVLGAYQGDVAAAPRAWMREHPDAVIGYIRAVRAATDWLYDPANRTEAIDILGRALPALSGPASEAAYGIMVDRENGLFPDLAISDAGLATVLRLRSEYSQEQRQLNDPSKYIDLSYLQAARS